VRWRAVLGSTLKRWRIKKHEVRPWDKTGFAKRAESRFESERRLLYDRVVDRRPEAFIQDLDSEQLSRGGGAVFVGGGQGDVEGQDLVGVPGQSHFFETLYVGQRDVVQLVDGSVDGHGNVSHQGGVED